MKLRKDKHSMDEGTWGFVLSARKGFVRVLALGFGRVVYSLSWGRGDDYDW